MNIEETINKLEIELSYYSALPLIVPGLIKVGLGLVQTVTALALSVLLILPVLYKYNGSKELLIHSFQHISHGSNNVLAGIIEAIPIVGTISVASRFIKVIKNNNPPLSSTATIYTMSYHPAFKYCPYSNISNNEFMKLQKQDNEN